MTGRFATLTFARRFAVPVATLWQAWTAPTARADWAPPAPDVTVEFLEADSRVGGREVSICRAIGQPDVRVEGGWLDLQPNARSVNYEVVSSEGQADFAALVAADFSNEDDGSRVVVTEPEWSRTGGASDCRTPDSRCQFARNRQNLRSYAPLASKIIIWRPGEDSNPRPRA